MKQVSRATHLTLTSHFTIIAKHTGEVVQVWLLVFTLWLRKYPETTSGIAWHFKANSHPFLIWSAGISLTVLIYMSPFGPVPTHLPLQAAFSPLPLLSALFMVLGVLSVKHLLSYPHRPGSAIRVSCSLSQWWITSCKKGDGRALAPVVLPIYHTCHLQSMTDLIIVSPSFGGHLFHLENEYLQIILLQCTYHVWHIYISNQIDLLVFNPIWVNFAIFVYLCTLLCGLGSAKYILTGQSHICTVNMKLLPTAF